VPIFQKTSPAKLVAGTLYDVLSTRVTDYTYVDFCAGAGGPTPFIEQVLNAKLSSRQPNSPAAPTGRIPKSPGHAVNGISSGAVKFVLTDIHPHIPDWTEAAKRSENLTFIAKSVDATNAPNDLIDDNGKKVFRLFNLAFHHFEDPLGKAILKNTMETADGFGYSLQYRRMNNLLTVI
jgi:hypothetical protein